MLWRRRLIVMMVATCFWILVAEVGARIWGGLFADPLDRARRVMKIHESRLWMMKPSAETKFEGAELITDEAGFRVPSDDLSTDFSVRIKNAEVLLLGPSSAFGWGVKADQTYFHKALQAVGAQGINLSQVGYGIQQGREIWRDLARQFPELADPGKPARVVVLAYGVNDIDRARFFVANGRPDREFFGDQVEDKDRRAWRDQLTRESMFLSTALGQLLLRSLQELSFAVGCASPHKLETRSTPVEFVEILMRWKMDLENLGHIVFVLDSPYSYPFTLNEGLAANAESLFTKSAEASHAGNCTEARSWLNQARQAEPHRVLRSLQQLNARLDEAFANKSPSNSPVAPQSSDPPGPFGGLLRVRHEVASQEDFVDPIHFSVGGHEKIAAKLTPPLRQALAQLRGEK